MAASSQKSQCYAGSGTAFDGGRLSPCRIILGPGCRVGAGQPVRLVVDGMGQAASDPPSVSHPGGEPLARCCAWGRGRCTSGDARPSPQDQASALCSFGSSFYAIPNLVILLSLDRKDRARVEVSTRALLLFLCPLREVDRITFPYPGTLTYNSIDFRGRERRRLFEPILECLEQTEGEPSQADA